MWFQQLIREETGCASYMLGSSETGQCAVFDPLWDIEPYLSRAERRGVTISEVIDSHSHADHVSGARRLAAATGARLRLPALAEVAYERPHGPGAPTPWGKKPSRRARVR